MAKNTGFVKESEEDSVLEQVHEPSAELIRDKEFKR